VLLDRSEEVPVQPRVQTYIFFDLNVGGMQVKQFSRSGAGH